MKISSTYYAIIARTSLFRFVPDYRFRLSDRQASWQLGFFYNTQLQLPFNYIYSFSSLLS
ncbi:hypothetical protein [Paenibacillus hunanensis]|uniref:hypothetical protein n=1 Tax=Paenibacillus hunanensis TaxID=539262 RepID=UPI00286BAB82|nr:hypothetical protein [Paenibacillus hunanensis]